MTKTLNRQRSSKEQEMIPLSGLMFCADCGYAMMRGHSTYILKSGEKRRSYSYTCGLYAGSGITACDSHYISEKNITALVCAAIRKNAEFVVCDEDNARKKFKQIKKDLHEKTLADDVQLLKKTEKRLNELNKLIEAAFENMVLNDELKETFNEYAQKFTLEKLELTKKAEQLSTNIERQKQANNDVELFIKLIKQYIDITELDRETVTALIERIEISSKTTKPREITIYYNFIGKIN
jgi:hypothetical protein